MSVGLPDIVAQIRGYAADADLQPVMNAYVIAAKAHAGQTRKSGEPYVSHPLAVASILAGMRMDVETIATALLHDALEDNPISKAELSKEVGPVIAELVDGVTKVGKLKYRSKEELQAENFRKMMLAMSRDVRVILVKLADRLHNMQTIGHHDKVEKRQTIARETMEIYVPIAYRLGLARLKTELEDHCFRVLHPEAAAAIEAWLQDTQADRTKYIEQVRAQLEAMCAGVGVPATVSGRAKEPYSIFRKMEAQGLTVDRVPDLLAFRLLVEGDDVGRCYLLLGEVHHGFPPVPGRIKDYIGRPKPNGYRSLHTTVEGPMRRAIEVQIRTEAMHRQAEEGVASHWRYKEGHLAITAEEIARISRIRELVEAAMGAPTAADFMQTVKGELYGDEVFVFTPAGDVKRLRAGATVLDFAYAVHTQVGHRCSGARVNGAWVKLSYELKTGDSVHILTSTTQKPTHDWLQIATTGRAHERIKRFLHEEERGIGIAIAQNVVEAELKRLGWSLAKARTEGLVAELLAETGAKDLDDVLFQVVRGQFSAAAIARKLVPESEPAPPSEPASAFGGLLRRFRRPTEPATPVLIGGEAGMVIRMARCCTPLRGQPIEGYITRGKGFTVHRVECAELKKLDPNLRIRCAWDPDSTARQAAEISVVCSDRPGILASISKTCEVANVNIGRAEVRPLSDGRALVVLEVAVFDGEELARLIRSVEKVPGVESVSKGPA